MWLVLYGAALLGAVANPLLGLFGYLLEYFQRPDLYWWGRDLPDLRWNFAIAAVAIGAYMLRSGSLPSHRRTTSVALALLLLQAVNTSVVTTWAVAPDLSWKWSVQDLKLAATFFLFSGVVRTPRALMFVILMQVAGAAWWGFDALGAGRTHGRLEGFGSGDTQNSNLMAAHLLTVIPLTAVCALTNRRGWMRAIAVVSLPLTVNLLILCNSRGATLGLGVIVLSAFVLAAGMRKQVAVGAAAAAVAVWMLADPQFLARQATITSAQDNSAQTRLNLWAGSLAMVRDYPFGTGGRGFHMLSPRYVEGIQENNDGEGRSPHNTLIQIAADWGIQGLLLFAAFIGYTFVLLHRVRRECSSRREPYLISLALQLGLIGTLVSGFFSELILWRVDLLALRALDRSLYPMTGTARHVEGDYHGEGREIAA